MSFSISLLLRASPLRKLITAWSLSFIMAARKAFCRRVSCSPSENHGGWYSSVSNEISLVICERMGL